MFKRIHLIVLDSVGIGEAPDSALYGDTGADTLGHIAEKMNGLKMPNMAGLGLSHIREIKGIPKVEKPKGYYTMNDNYFDKFTIDIIINKRYLTEEQRELLNQEPIEYDMDMEDEV